MIIESIVLVIFTISFGGVLLILIRKAPVLVELPQNGKIGIRDHHVILNIENKIKDIFVSFEKQILFHKFLSWVKVMTLKVEVKVDHLLHSIRRKAQNIDNNIKDKK